jgi:hypothetical protein
VRAKGGHRQGEVTVVFPGAAHRPSDGLRFVEDGLLVYDGGQDTLLLPPRRSP